jgi:hypothetical protein
MNMQNVEHNLSFINLYSFWSKSHCDLGIKPIVCKSFLISYFHLFFRLLVAIVHVLKSPTKVVQYVQNSIKNLSYFAFAVPWPTDPFLGDKLYQGTCVEQEDWTYLCDVAISNSMVFSREPANADIIRSMLKIGPFEPDYYESGYYNSA